MQWFVLNALIVLLAIWTVSRKYRTLLNPIGFFGAFYFMAGVVVPLISEIMGVFRGLSVNSVRYTSALSTLFFAALSSAFLTKSSPLKLVFAWVFRATGPLRVPSKSDKLTDLAMFAQFVILFVLLMIGSGVGSLWITNSREAYALHRASVGVLWSLCLATLLLWFISVIFRKKRSITSLIAFATSFGAIAWFLGSKGAIVAFFIITLFHIHFHVKPVSNRTVILVGAIVLLVIMGAQLVQGTADSILSTLFYFDYFSNTAALIDRFKEFGFRYGAVGLSNLWYYVPRSLYPSKPFVYALVIADDFLYPGAAENGYSPGMMLWTQGYCDFGVAGVILAGLFSGFISKGAYELFIERRDVQSMAFLFQTGMIYGIELFANAPLPIFFIWLIAELTLIRILAGRWPFPSFRIVLFPSVRFRLGKSSC